MALGLGVLCGCGGGSSAKILYVLGLGSSSVSILQVTGSGALSASGELVETGAAPDAMGIDPLGRFAYIVDSGCASLIRSACVGILPGAVSQYVVSASTGNLTVATFSSTTGTPQSQPVTTGVNPSAIAIDSTGTFVFVANQGSNSISVFLIDSVGGTLSEVKQVQPPCTANQQPACPLPAPGSPSALAITGKTLFVAMTSAGAGSLATYTFDSTGTLKTPAAFTTPPGGNLVNPAAMVLDPSGKFLLVADSVANTVAAFSVAGSGQLTPVGAPVNTGTTPVSLHVAPSGKFLFTANLGSNDVSAFSLDSSTGALMPLSDTPVTPGASPSYVTTDASGSFLFVANRDSGNISAFTIDSSGALKQVTGSPFAAGVFNPVALASLN